MPKAGISLVMVGCGLLFLSAYVGPRLRSLNPFKGIMELDAESNAKLADTIAGKLEPKIQSIAEQGTYYFDNEKAFTDLSLLIDKAATRQENIDLRLIAVAMRYSAPFLSEKLIPIIGSHRNVHFKFRFATVDPKFMERFEFDTLEFDWVKCSRELASGLNHIRTQLKSKGLENVTLEVFHFEGIPPWHGFLLNCEHLFLGRTDWDWDTASSNPRLSVGNNQYRYYGKATEAGERRIKLFRHWFTWYTKYYLLKDHRSNQQPSLI